MGSEEVFDLVNEQGEVVGSATRGEVHGNPALLHRSVHVIVLHPGKRAIYLQKRAGDKDIQPGRWDTSVGGHVDSGENVTEAARREMREELGIGADKEMEFLYSYIWRTEVESELVSTFLCRHPGPFRLLRSEIDEGRFWSFAEIEENLGSGVFTPNFEEEYSRLLRLPESRE